MVHPEGGADRAEGEAPIARLRALVLAFAAALAFAARAQDEHGRRLAAELVVMAGDARRLAAAAVPPPEREGLRARLAGALSSLPLLVRKAGGTDRGEVQRLRRALGRADWTAFERELSVLRARHPLDLRHLLPPAQPAPAQIALGRTIHRQACAGCHDAPVRDSTLPARDLFEEIRAMPREEFAARLLAGVRGDASTAHRNPFSDLELGALIAWYASGARE